MSFLSKGTIGHMIDMGRGYIEQNIAERQLEVIRKGFNYLTSSSDANLLYIGDEVGLGKTFIALGIASLLRHFSPTPESYQDLIIVPKENLQVKWSAAIRQFIQNNYLLADNRVKSVLGTPVGSIEQHQRLEAFMADVPAYHIYRNSTFSFSFGLGADKAGKLRELQDRLVTDNAKSLLEQAWSKDYYRAEKKRALKRLFGYLLNSGMPQIELLIVDEGHNFKHGIEGDTVSDRNQVISRFMGILQAEEDTALLDDFPELSPMVKPLAAKTVMLSATPKTYSLTEMSRQAACFLPSHILSGNVAEEEIKATLRHFFIRGNLNYKIGDEDYSRNRCRQEHRAGGVYRNTDNTPLTIQTDEQAALLALLQYKTIKHLNAKHNASFELGMLAGFETFRHDMQVREARKALLSVAFTEETDEGQDGAEYEETRSRTVQQSQDIEVISPILQSYRQTFNDEPPHPKQDGLVAAVGEMMLRGEKSLVFVRRIGSAKELEERLLAHFEKAVATELQTRWRKVADSNLLSAWVDAFDNRELHQKSDELFAGIIRRLISDKRFTFQFGEEGAEATLAAGLQYLLRNTIDDVHRAEWLQLLRNQLKLTNYKRELIEASYTLLTAYWRKWEESTFSDYEEEGDDGDSTRYFFHNNSLSGLKAFKKRLGASNWLEPNYYLIHRELSLGRFEGRRFSRGHIPVKDAENLREVQRLFLSSATANSGSDEIAHEEDAIEQLFAPTLLTTLLLKYCRRELGEFLAKRQSEGARLKADLEVLMLILQGVLRKGSGLVPLAIAMSGKEAEATFFKMLNDDQSIFHLVLSEVRTIIRDFNLITTANFSDASERQILDRLNGQVPVVGITGQSGRSRSTVAAQFRMPGFPYVLVTTDIFREGEDLHTYCQNIYHYGIAWNCSDMEQRTGRIDRINSQAYRRLVKASAPQFEDKVHIFYPFISGSLEVNQISCLYHSLNNFVETFNDFTRPHTDHSVASTASAIDELPPVIDAQLTSLYEHTAFAVVEEEGIAHPILPLIGSSAGELKAWMQTLCGQLIRHWDIFLLPPTISSDGFSIKAVPQLPANGRKGPFVVELINTVRPGIFAIKLSSHVCAAQTRYQAGVTSRQGVYALESTGGFFLFIQYYELNNSNYIDICNAIERLILHADLVEQAVTGADLMPFG